MRVRFILLTALCLAVSASAFAAVVNVPSVSQLPAGWSTTIVPDSTGRGIVQDKTSGGVNGFGFTNGDKDKTAGCWAALSTTNYDNVRLADITALSIRVYGNEGDGTTWQVPHFVLACKKEEANLSHRFVEWVPWSDGVVREPGVWKTYNALVDGSWVLPWTGATYPTLADAVAAYPDIRIANATEIQTMLAGFAGKGFNVGYGDWIFQTKPYNDSARGMVDWFSVGIAGSDVVTYDLFEPVPEPASILALATGLVGLVGLRRKF